MTTDDERPEENDANTAEEDPSAQEMEAYIKALNRFVQQVADMDWPEQFQLDNDEKFCFSVFRTFWRQRHRQREQGGGSRRFHMRFEGPDAEEARRFMQEKFGRMFGNDSISTTGTVLRFHCERWYTTGRVPISAHSLYSMALSSC